MSGTGSLGPEVLLVVLAVAAVIFLLWRNASRWRGGSSDDALFGPGTRISQLPNANHLAELFGPDPSLAANEPMPPTGDGAAVFGQGGAVNGRRCFVTGRARADCSCARCKARAAGKGA